MFLRTKSKLCFYCWTILELKINLDGQETLPILFALRRIVVNYASKSSTVVLSQFAKQKLKAEMYFRNARGKIYL
jgi:hypothetical protein